jgi:hypothetical protein
MLFDRADLLAPEPRETIRFGDPKLADAFPHGVAVVERLLPQFRPSERTLRDAVSTRSLPLVELVLRQPEVSEVDQALETALELSYWAAERGGDRASLEAIVTRLISDPRATATAAEDAVLKWKRSDLLPAKYFERPRTQAEVEALMAGGNWEVVERLLLASSATAELLCLSAGVVEDVTAKDKLIPILKRQSAEIAAEASSQFKRTLAIELVVAGIVRVTMEEAARTLTQMMSALVRRGVWGQGAKVPMSILTEVPDDLAHELVKARLWEGDWRLAVAAKKPRLVTALLEVNAFTLADILPDLELPCFAPVLDAAAKQKTCPGAGLVILTFIAREGFSATLKQLGMLFWLSVITDDAPLFGWVPEKFGDGQALLNWALAVPPDGPAACRYPALVNALLDFAEIDLRGVTRPLTEVFVRACDEPNELLAWKVEMLFDSGRVAIDRALISAVASCRDRRVFDLFAKLPAFDPNMVAATEPLVLHLFGGDCSDLCFETIAAHPKLDLDAGLPRKQLFKELEAKVSASGWKRGRDQRRLAFLEQRVPSFWSSWPRPGPAAGTLLGDHAAAVESLGVTLGGAKLLVAFAPGERDNKLDAAVIRDHLVGVARTLVIAKTVNDTICGGFTPVEWPRAPASGWVVAADPSGEGFIFSVAPAARKFKLRPGQHGKAIHVGAAGPFGFGDRDLAIRSEIYTDGVHQYEPRAISLFTGSPASTAAIAYIEAWRLV